MLDDGIKGHVKHGSKPGPSTILTEEEEQALEVYLFYMGDHCNSELSPGDHWWYNFNKCRHPLEKLTCCSVPMEKLLILELSMNISSF